MGRCDPHWIIILFVIHLDAFTVEKVEELGFKTIFIGMTQFGKTGVLNLLGAFWGIKRHFLGVRIFRIIMTPTFHIIHIENFPMVQESRQS